jgi:hypothetical protein
MTISMFARGLLLTLACAVPGRAQTMHWAEDFESGAGAWSVTGLWHLVDGASACLADVAPFPSGSRAMWYGVEGACDYDVGTTAGVLTLIAPVTLPTVHEGGVTLRYRMWREGEPCGSPIFTPYDWSESRVLDGSGVQLVAQIECMNDFAWRSGRVDLAPYLGNSIRVAFSFNTVDWGNNYGLGLFLDDVSIELEPGLSYCESQSCPCSGAQSAVNSQLGGCRHSSSGPNGAELRGSGTPAVASDDVVLAIEGMPATSFVTFLQGDVAPAVPFGDGKLCLGGSLVRIAVRPAVGGAASYPSPGEESLSLRGAIPAAGATVGYQGRYRDNATAWCTPATFNTTNAYRVVWIP